MKKYTLITGASSGLGEVYAEQYAQKKQNLILVARRLDRLELIKSRLIAKYPIDVKVLSADLGDALALQQFIENISGYAIDRLVNNAGFGHSGAFVEQESSNILQMNHVNIDALTLLCHALIPSLKRNKPSEIINVASVAAFVAGPYMAQYYATKAYVLNFSLALREELKKDGISVSVLCPGPTQTEFFDVANRKEPNPSVNLVMMDSKPVVQASVEGVHKAIIVPGFSNKLMVLLLKFVPRVQAAKIVARIQKVKTN